MLPGLCLMDVFFLHGATVYVLVRHRSHRDGPDTDTRDRGLFSSVVRQRILRTRSDRA